MRIEEVMTRRVISVRQNETADVAARLLSRNNIGVLPVCDENQRVVGMLTDRDLVTRCMAAGYAPSETPVARIMSTGVLTAEAGEDTGAVSARMGKSQVRRIPVTKDGMLLGIVSLSDLARANDPRIGQTLSEISGNISRR